MARRPVTDVCVCLATVPDEETGARIAYDLVEEGLCACVNIGGDVRSIYRWQGEIEDDEERILVIKTRAGRFDALEERLVELHPYDVPELIRLPVEAGHAPYLDWVREETA